MKKIILSNYCGWGENTKVKKLLEKYSNIDLTEDNGICFRLAIKHKNVEILNILLDYYEKTKMTGNYDSIEYQIAKRKLQDILEDAVESFDISDEIQEVLNKYIPENNDTSSEQDSQDLESEFEDLEIFDNEGYLPLTVDNLEKHNLGLIGQEGPAENE